MAEVPKMRFLDSKKENTNHSAPKKSKKIKYLIFMIVIIIAVFVYDVSPIDLVPFVPIDDIAITGGGFMGILSLLFKYYKKDKQAQ